MEVAYHKAMTNGDTDTAEILTRIAVLGTLTEFHADPLPYDLKSLVDLVAGINPDLLCLDMTLTQWQQQDFSRLSSEYREALLPLAAQTDMVVVPIGGEQAMPRATAVGWRNVLISGVRKLLGWLQATAPTPDAINQGWRHELANLLYGLTRRLAGKTANHAYHVHIEQLAQAALQAATNNPGNRILVVTNIQYCHHIRPRLVWPGIQETTYTNL